MQGRIVIRLALLAVALAPAPSAHAEGVVRMAGAQRVEFADLGPTARTNRLAIAISGTDVKTYVISDLNANALTNGAPGICTKPDVHVVSCEVAGGTGVDVDLGGAEIPGAGQSVELVHSTAWARQTTRIVGGPGPDVLTGSDGADTLVGNGGADVFRGSPAGADDEAYDTVSYADATQPVGAVVGGGAVSGIGCPLACEGDNIGSTVEQVVGGSGDDVLTGDPDRNLLLGGGGNDLLQGAWGNDDVHGQDGNDLVRGGLGHDTLTGGAGTDTLDYSADGRNGPVGVDLANQTMTAEDADDDVIRDGAFERLVGTPYADILNGTAAADVILGGGGDDRIMGRGGADDVSGGPGDDTFTYADGLHDSGSTRVTLDNLADDGAADEGDNLREDVENVVAGAAPTTFVGSDAANAFTGGAGIDVVSWANRSEPISASLRSGRGAPEGDTFTGVEHLTGGSGPDVLEGNGAANTLTGGDGDDLLRGGMGTDTLAGGAGADSADYSRDGRTIGILVDLAAQRGADDDVFTGIEGAVGTAVGDVLTGDGNANRLAGGDGSDRLAGEEGDDLLVPGAGADTVDGGGGADTASYADHTEPVRVTIDDRPDDGAAGEQDNVGTSVENLLGGSGDDVLSAGAGTTANVLDGGPGRDVLTAGAGDDRLRTLDEGADEAACGTGSDVVEADHLDTIAGDCEQVSRTTPPAPPTAGSDTGAVLQGSGSAPGPAPVRGASTPRLPRGTLMLSLRPGRISQLPARVVASGRLVLPAGVSEARGCRGNVIVELLAGRRILATRVNSVAGDCRFIVALPVVGRAKLPPSGRLRIAALFEGNRFLARAQARGGVRVRPR